MALVAQSSSGGVAISYVLPVFFIDDARLANNGQRNNGQIMARAAPDLGRSLMSTIVSLDKATRRVTEKA